MFPFQFREFKIAPKSDNMGICLKWWTIFHLCQIREQRQSLTKGQLKGKKTKKKPKHFLCILFRVEINNVLQAVVIFFFLGHIYFILIYGTAHLCANTWLHRQGDEKMCWKTESRAKRERKGGEQGEVRETKKKPRILQMNTDERDIW